MHCVFEALPSNATRLTEVSGQCSMVSSVMTPAYDVMSVTNDGDNDVSQSTVTSSVKKRPLCVAGSCVEQSLSLIHI